MDRNFFTYAGNSVVEYRFLCWCLEWYNQRLESESGLCDMAGELLAFMGETDLAENQKVDVFQWEDFDILINLCGLNRVLVIDHMVGSDTYGKEIARYRRRLMQEKHFLKIDESVQIRTILFHTSFCDDFYLEAEADCKIDRASLLTILEKYEGISKSLDLYVESLRDRIAIDTKAGKYDLLLPENAPLKWNISCQRVAQYCFMRDIFREHYPISIWRRGEEAYKISQGTNQTRLWTAFMVFEVTYPEVGSGHELYWHLEATDEGPLLSLCFREWTEQKGNGRCLRHEKIRKKIRNIVRMPVLELPDSIFEFSETENYVTEEYMGICYAGSIISARLGEYLKHWSEKSTDIKHQILTVTDCCLKEEAGILAITREEL